MKKQSKLDEVINELYFGPSTKHFREISIDTCQKQKLCTTSTESSKLRCGRKSVKAYRSTNPEKFKKWGIQYVCENCCPYDLPNGFVWCDKRTGEID